MSKLEVDAIEPQSGTTLTIGASGDSVNMASGAKLKVVGTGVNGIELGQQSDGTDSSRLFFTNNTNVCAIRSKSSVGGIVLSTGATIGSSSGDDRITIHSNGIMSASEGIALGVGNNDTASNVLNDYEEGTWTPALALYGGTPTIANAVYTKVGRLVMASATISLDGTNDGSTFKITGLPFTCQDTTNSVFGGIISISNSTLERINIIVTRNSTEADLYKSSGTLLTYNSFGNDKYIRFSLIYQTD